MAEQLVLNVHLRDAAVFDAFYAGTNGAVLESLKGLASGTGEQQVYAWGAMQTGKSHLLQAVCHQAAESGASSAYLPLAQFPHSPEVLADMESVQVLAVDDLDLVAGKADWEFALFNLINGLRAQGHRLAMASVQNPVHLPVGLPDLASRLLWGPVFRLEALSDDGKLAALQHRALRRGFDLPTEVAAYMLRHQPRDLDYLMGLLDDIDAATLAAQRRATLPFIKSVLADR